MGSLSNSEYGSKDVDLDWVITKFPQVVGSFITIKEFKYYYSLGYPIGSTWWGHCKCRSTPEQLIEVGL